MGPQGFPSALGTEGYQTDSVGSEGGLVDGIIETTLSASQRSG